MTIHINGIELPEQYSVLDGLTYEHVYFNNISASTKELLFGFQDYCVKFSYRDDDDVVHEYPEAKIIYLGNNTLYVCSWIN